MPDRTIAGPRVADAFRELNRTDLRGELVAGLIDAGVAWRLRRFRVIRPDDLLVLDIALDNIGIGGGVMTRAEAGKPALLIVGHALQAIAERAFLSTGGQANYQDAKEMPEGDRHTASPHRQDSPAFPTQARGAGPSRLVFRMPTSGSPLPFTLDGVLEACRSWELQLNWAARPAPAEDTSTPYHWRDLVDHTRLVGMLLQESVLNALGDANVARLRREAEQLGQRVSRTPVRGGRPAFKAQVARVVEQVLGAAAADDRDTDRPLARGYVEVIAAGASLGNTLQAAPDWSQNFGDLWPYLLQPSAPASHETAIELPYRLIGSPLAGAGFTHALRPVEHAGRTELWHTRLGRRIDATRVDDRAVQPMRYLWSPDFEGNASGDLNSSLDWLDRQMIVKLTAGYAYSVRDKPRTRYVPRPVDVHKLHLTALGGALDLDKAWREQPEGVDVLSWTHRANLARDFYVRVEYAGYLFPFGHAASLIKVTERKFEEVDGFGAVAPLRQRFYIVARDRVRTFNGQAPQPDGGRGLPFVRIECLTQVTPDIEKPGLQQRDLVGSGSGSAEPTSKPPLYADAAEYRMAFWPTLADPTRNNLRFQFVGIDAAGRRIPFDAPALFVSDLYNVAAKLGTIASDYAGETLRRKPSLGNANVRMAPVDQPDAADVDLPVSSLTLRAQVPSGTYAYNTARFFPDVEQAQVRLPAIERMTGQPKSAIATFPNLYRQHGFGAANPGQVFLGLASDALDFGAGSVADKAGGVATPNLSPSALSRAFGLGSGELQKLADNQFDPEDFFPGGADDAGTAKLLGFIPLRLLLNTASMTDLVGAPKLDTRELSDRIVTRLHLEQSPLRAPAGFEDVLLLDAGGVSRLTLDSVNTIWLDPTKAPESMSDGELAHFKINLFGCIVLWFDRLHFRAQAGHKPEVDVDLNAQHGVTFGGPLEFVNTLKDLIPSNGFSDPPGLSVTPQGITASFSLALPNVQVGILALSNINLGAAFNLPFTGDRPSLRFNFAERHNTFNLTVSLFGGGGFFAIGVDTGGVNEIEAALEFGAAAQIDLGVASGSVYVKGGFYFHYSEENVHFEGYLEMGGRLRIIGLISVSLTFHLALAYDCDQKTDSHPVSVSRLYGEASLVVEVEVLFFSASVTVKIKREFAGSESDPTFLDFIPDDSTWQTYCQAYA